MHGLVASEMLLKQTLDAYKSVNCYSSSDENDEDYENPSDVEIIQRMVKAPQTAPIIQSRILCVLHNIPARMFRTFEVKTFGIEPLATLPHFEPNEDEDQEEYVPEIYKVIFALNCFILRWLTHKDLVNAVCFMLLLVVEGTRCMQR
ncbi:hypothetical protein TSMEX_002390 [Taenia solium]|eukprot:TsM_000211500 transcript=TsM_000211500 gene=TsM_000211500